MITKNPTNRENLTERVWYFSAARTAFRHLLNQMEFGEDDVILLPSYIGITDREGSGVMDPIWESGIKYDFFHVDSHLNADLADLFTRIQAGCIKALLLIHYFGFPQKQVFKIRDFCKRNDVHLIEDCAHSLYGKLGESDLGSIGDFSFFSIHKSIPSETGGFLRSNLDQFELTKQIGDEERIDLSALEVFTRVRVADVVEKRFANYEYLAQLLENCPGVTLMFPELPAGVVPLNMPVLIGNDQREALYFCLMEQGLPTIALYYRLIDDLHAEDFKVSRRISENILNLPIHQDVETSELIELVGAIREFFHAQVQSNERRQSLT
jgi:dTDP-4-amino-4,6-dideoxygalactose transaminase